MTGLLSIDYNVIIWVKRAGMGQQPNAFQDHLSLGKCLFKKADDRIEINSVLSKKVPPIELFCLFQFQNPIAFGLPIFQKEGRPKRRNF